jgi:hypothetical protein
MNDFNQPLKDWDYDKLQRFMAWKIIEGFTSGKTPMEIVWGFPMVVLEWHKHQDEKEKKKND